MKPDQKPIRDPFFLFYPSELPRPAVGNLHPLSLASERLYEGASGEEMLIAACEGTIEPNDTGNKDRGRTTDADEAIFAEIADGIPDPCRSVQPLRRFRRPSEALLDQDDIKPHVLQIGCDMPDPICSMLPVEAAIAGNELSVSHPNGINVDPTAEDRELYYEYLEFLRGSRLPPRPLDAWVRYYHERCSEEPTAQEREMYQQYVEFITGSGVVEHRSLEKWVRDYRKHQTRPPTVDEQEMYAEYVDFVRGTSVVPRTLDDWVRDYRRHQIGVSTSVKPGSITSSEEL